MPERTIMKNISEMNQSEKQELLKKIEEKRQEQIKTLRDIVEELQRPFGMRKFLMLKINND